MEADDAGPAPMDADDAAPELKEPPAPPGTPAKPLVKPHGVKSTAVAALFHDEPQPEPADAPQPEPADAPRPEPADAASEGSSSSSSSGEDLDQFVDELDGQELSTLAGSALELLDDQVVDSAAGADAHQARRDAIRARSLGVPC